MWYAPIENENRPPAYMPAAAASAASSYRCRSAAAHEPRRGTIQPAASPFKADYSAAPRLTLSRPTIAASAAERKETRGEGNTTARQSFSSRPSHPVRTSSAAAYYRAPPSSARAVEKTQQSGVGVSQNAFAVSGQRRDTGFVRRPTATDGEADDEVYQGPPTPTRHSSSAGRNSAEWCVPVDPVLVQRFKTAFRHHTDDLHDEKKSTRVVRRDRPTTAAPVPEQRQSTGETVNLSSFATQVSKGSPPVAPIPHKNSNAASAMMPSFSSFGKSTASGAGTPRGPAGNPTPKYDEYDTVIHPPHKNSSKPILPYRHTAHKNRNLLLLDLDETLVHASAQPTDHDHSFYVDMGSQRIQIFVKFRPYMMEFLRVAAGLFEVGVFTASLSKYADQVLNHIDPKKEFITHRLFREHCTQVDGSYVKDLSILGRPLEKVCLVDNSPVAYLLHPGNALPCTSWFDDPRCTELKQLLPILEKLARSPNMALTLSQQTFPCQCQ